jgi:hypothetical protein
LHAFFKNFLMFLSISMHFRIEHVFAMLTALHITLSTVENYLFSYVVKCGWDSGWIEAGRPWSWEYFPESSRDPPTMSTGPLSEIKRPGPGAVAVALLVDALRYKPE